MLCGASWCALRRFYSTSRLNGRLGYLVMLSGRGSYCSLGSFNSTVTFGAVPITLE